MKIYYAIHEDSISVEFLGIRFNAPKIPNGTIVEAVTGAVMSALASNKTLLWQVPTPHAVDLSLSTDRADTLLLKRIQKHNRAKLAEIGVMSKIVSIREVANTHTPLEEIESIMSRRNLAKEISYRIIHEITK